MPEDSDCESDPLIETIINCDDWQKLDFEPIAKAQEIIKSVLKEFEDANGAIDVLLTDDGEIRELNKKWRNIDKPTNVLSFEHIGANDILGDIAISLSYCQKEAENQNKNLKNHFTHLLVHGTLHLLGYDHINEVEAQEMENLERDILAKMGISDPYILGDING